MIMNTLTALTLSTTFAASLFSAAAMGNEIDAQMRTVAEQQLTELSQGNRHQARLALIKTGMELLAWQSAEQYAAAMLHAEQMHIATAE
jgi:hypothetical protein